MKGMSKTGPACANGPAQGMTLNFFAVCLKRLSTA